MILRSIETPRKEYLLLTALFVIGAYFRFYGSTDVPFSVDEYFLTKSTLSIMQNGLPDFYFGGYYTRGLLQQYLSAFLIFLFGDIEFSMRFLPILAGLATAIGVFKLTRLVTTDKVATLGAAIILFSIWEIELSRFARMYALQQAMFVWQVYFLIKALFYHQAKNFRYAVLLALITALTSEGAVFSVAICLIPLLVLPELYHPKEALLILLATVLMLIFIFIDWRHYGVENWLPEDLDITRYTNLRSSPILLPSTGFISLLSHSLGILFAYSLLVFAGLISYIQFFAKQAAPFKNIVAVVLLVLPALHLPGLSLVVAAALWLLYFFSKDPLKNFRIALYIGSHALIWVCVWIAIETLTTPDATIKPMLTGLLKYPNFWDPWLFAWYRYMPITTSLLCLGFAVAVISHFFDISARARSLRFILALLLFTLTLFGLISTNYTASRYSYFLYPLFIVCLIAGIHAGLAKLNLQNKVLIAGTYLITTAGFVMSDDFNLRHAMNINSYEFVYRTHYPASKRDHYKVRYDIASAASFTLNASSSCDRIVSVFHEIELYIPDFQYFYITEDSLEILGISANGGKNELWTGKPLIRKESELHGLMNNHSCTTWFVMRPHLLPAWMKDHVVYETPSKQIVVVSNNQFESEN